MKISQTFILKMRMRSLTYLIPMSKVKYKKTEEMTEKTNKNVNISGSGTSLCISDSNTKVIKPVLKFWETTVYKTLNNNRKETQYEYYKRMNSRMEVLQLVPFNSKQFGTIVEKIIREQLELANRGVGESEYDAKKNGKNIEIKSARYWAGTDDCRWQHLELTYNYDLVLFVLLGFHDWNIWAVSKSLLKSDMIDKKIITPQGKQGYWVKKSIFIKYYNSVKNDPNIKNHITQFTDMSKLELNKFIKGLDQH